MQTLLVAWAGRMFVAPALARVGMRAGQSPRPISSVGFAPPAPRDSCLREQIIRPDSASGGTRLSRAGGLRAENQSAAGRGPLHGARRLWLAERQRSPDAGMLSLSRPTASPA